MAEIGLFEAIHSQRAIRRYKPDPVPDELVHRVLDAAIRAPSAINVQPWRFIVVKDAATRRKIADFYHTAWKTGQDNPQTQAVLKTRDPSIVSHATQFATEGIYQVPVFIFVCATQRDAADSVLQAVQNLMLAARGLGLGTVFTTLLRRHDAEIRELLSVPEDSEVVCMIPLGYPETGFGPTRRRPVEEVAFAERWGTPLR